MTTKTKSRILEAVHESASDLHRLGFIDKRKMQKYDALCLEPVQDYDAEKVKALRERLHLSQAVLASVLNTSTSLNIVRRAAESVSAMLLTSAAPSQ